MEDYDKAVNMLEVYLKHITDDFNRVIGNYSSKLQDFYKLSADSLSALESTKSEIEDISNKKFNDVNQRISEIEGYVDEFVEYINVIQQEASNLKGIMSSLESLCNEK